MADFLSSFGYLVSLSRLLYQKAWKSAVLLMFYAGFDVRKLSKRQYIVAITESNIGGSRNG
jgi:hypothetical protein